MLHVRTDKIACKTFSKSLKQSAEACCSSSHSSGGLSSVAVCAFRHNEPFRWRAHQHIHRLMQAIVATARLEFYTNPVVMGSWRGENKGGWFLTFKDSGHERYEWKLFYSTKENRDHTFPFQRIFRQILIFPLKRCTCHWNIHHPAKYFILCMLGCHWDCCPSAFIDHTHKKVKEGALFDT